MLYNITKEQIIFEESVKQYLNNGQLYKVNNRIKETSPLEFYVGSEQ